MLGRPSLSNGYLWICNAAMPSSTARTIEQGIGDIRHEITVRDMSKMGHPQAETIVELWAHPGDEGRASEIVRSALAGS